jgi:hypothetical protein
MKKNAKLARRYISQFIKFVSKNIKAHNILYNIIGILPIPYISFYGVSEKQAIE